MFSYPMASRLCLREDGGASRKSRGVESLGLAEWYCSMQFVPGLLKALRTGVVEGVRYALWDMTGRHRDYVRRLRVAGPGYGGAEVGRVGDVS